eukprot:3931-Heterococcus_DN1.PRE.2
MACLTLQSYYENAFLRTVHKPVATTCIRLDNVAVNLQAMCSLQRSICSWVAPETYTGQHCRYLQAMSSIP